MPRVVFTDNLQRHVNCPPCEVNGPTVRAALDAYFSQFPGVRGYILDEHGAVRPHIIIFADGLPLRDRGTLSDAVGPSDEVYVMQALSGG